VTVALQGVGEAGDIDKECSRRTGWPINLEESELQQVWIFSGQPQAPGQAVMCSNLHSAGHATRRELGAGKSV